MKKTWILVCAFLLMAGAAQASDNYLGTWKLDVAKSRFDPGPGPKSQTTKLEAASGGLREVVDRVNSNNTRDHWEWTAKYDGKDYPVNGDPDRDAVTIRRVNDNAIEIISKKAGKITTSMKIVVSPDGKFRTNVVTGTTTKGQPVNHLLIFERQ